MESLIAKALKKYLSVFIVNFSSDNFNVSLLKGKASLSNIDLNCAVLQEVLMLPTSLQVKKAYCTLLEIDVPWTKLNSKPIVVVVQKIDLFLQEPQEVPPMPTELANFRKKRKKKKSSGNSSYKDILYGISVEIKEVNFFAQTQATNDKSFEPSLAITIKNVLIQSTSPNWEIADLSMCRDTDVMNPEVTQMYKSIKANSITVEVIEEKGKRIPLIDQQPLTIHFISKWNLKEGTWVGGSIEVIYNDLSFTFTNDDWKSVGSTIAAFRRCFSRLVPESPVPQENTSSSSADTTQRESIKKDLALNIRLSRWIFQIATTETEFGGFKFEGEGLELSMSTDSQGNQHSLLTLNNVSLHTLSANKLPLVSLKLNQESNLVTISFFSQAVLDEHKSEGALTDLSLKANVHSLQVVVDINAWLTLRSLLFEPFSNAPVPEKRPSKIKEKLKSKLKDQMERIQDFSIIKLYLEATNTNFIFCSEESDGIAAIIKADSASLRTDPKWSTIQLLDSVPTLSHDGQQQSDAAEENHDNNSHAEGKTKANRIKKEISKRFSNNTNYRLEGDLTNVSVHLSHLNAQQQDEKPVLTSDTMKLFFRYAQTTHRDPNNEGHSFLEFRPEMALHSGTLSVQVSQTQLFDAKRLFKHFQVSLKAPLKKASNLTQVKKKVIKDSIKKKIKTQLNGQPLELVDSVKSKVKKTLQRFKLIFFLRADRGDFSLPILGDEPNVRESAQFGFQVFEFGASNGSVQSVILNIKTIEATNLDHPKATSVVTIRPLYAVDSSTIKIFSLNTKQIYNFRISYTRSQPKIKDSGVKHTQSELIIKLHELQIVLKPKQNAPSSSSTPPDIKKIVNRIISLIDSKRDKILSKLDELKEKENDISALRSKLKFDLKWRVEMENLSVNLEDKITEEGNSGTLIISNTHQVNEMSKKFLELEQQLITAKVDLATLAGQSQLQQEQSFKQKRDLEAELQKYMTLFKDMESKYVETKLKYSQLQMEHENVTQQLAQLKRKK